MYFTLAQTTGIFQMHNCTQTVSVFSLDYEFFVRYVLHLFV